MSQSNTATLGRPGVTGDYYHWYKRHIPADLETQTSQTQTQETRLIRSKGGSRPKNYKSLVPWEGHLEDVQENSDLQDTLPAILFFGAWWALLFMMMMMASLGTKSPSPHSLSAAISFLDHAFNVLG